VTSKFASITPDAIVEIGTYDPRDGEIHLTDTAARDLLAGWLGLDPTDQALDQQLATQGSAAHENRRRIRAGLANLGAQTTALELFARQQGHQDLLG
jgi:hypothetical protein